MIKKYYSISEVSQITNLPQTKLRYIQNRFGSKITIKQIRGRRYYSKQNITDICKLLGIEANMENAISVKTSTPEPRLSLKEIDELIEKFQRIIE